MIKKLLIYSILCLFISNPVFAKNGITLTHQDKGVYVLKLDTNHLGDKIKPYAAEDLTTVTDVFKQNNFRLVVNGGFFDSKSGEPVSYVTLDKELIQDPFSNIKLIQDLAANNRLEAVLNRAELRILEDRNGKLTFDIDNHFNPVPEGYCVKHALQGGPMIMPKYNLEKESFVKYDSEGNVLSQSASVLKRRERTLLGLKGDCLYIIIFTTQNKVTISEAKDYCKKLRLNKLMALDGGASTSLNYEDIEIYSDAGSQRRVKSFLTVEN